MFMIFFEDGEADTANKHVDSRFTGWYYTEHFRYTIATQCACVKNNWQVGNQFSSFSYGNSKIIFYGKMPFASEIGNSWYKYTVQGFNSPE